MPAEEEKPTNPLIEYKQSNSFRNEYANNTFLEPTAWDLKINFGQIDKANTVTQHVALTLPWPQIKILCYFLQIQLLVHEANHGHIRIPKGIIPALPGPPTAEELKAFPQNALLHEKAQKLYEEFMTNNPEAK